MNGQSGYELKKPKGGSMENTTPIGISGGLNLYRFVNNNPVNYVDPRGLINVLDIVKDTISMSLYDTFYLSFGWLTDIDSPYKCRRECVRGCWKEFFNSQISGGAAEKFNDFFYFIVKDGLWVEVLVHKGIEKAFKVLTIIDAHNLIKCLRKCGRKK